MDEPCPSCDGTLLRGRFCRECGYDADLEDGDDAYLDGVDLGEDDYAETLRREGLVEGASTPVGWVALVVVVIVVGLLIASR